MLRFIAGVLVDRVWVVEAFNFSNELQITVLELVQKILALMDKRDLEPIILNQAKNEIKHQYLSATKAREMLNWYPQYSLEEGLKETIDWDKIFSSKQDN